MQYAFHRAQSDNPFDLIDFSDRSDISIIEVSTDRSEKSTVMGNLIGDTKLEILRHLRSEPVHGYALATELGLSHGYIYTHLGELQTAGMIEIAEEQEGKKIYRLTQKGEYLVKAFDE